MEEAREGASRTARRSSGRAADFLLGREGGQREREWDDGAAAFRDLEAKLVHCQGKNVPIFC